MSKREVAVAAATLAGAFGGYHLSGELGTGATQEQLWEAGQAAGHEEAELLELGGDLLCARIALRTLLSIDTHAFPTKANELSNNLSLSCAVQAEEQEDLNLGDGWPLLAQRSIDQFENVERAREKVDEVREDTEFAPEEKAAGIIAGGILPVTIGLFALLRRRR